MHLSVCVFPSYLSPTSSKKQIAGIDVCCTIVGIDDCCTIVISRSSTDDFKKRIRKKIATV